MPRQTSIRSSAPSASGGRKATLRQSKAEASAPAVVASDGSPQPWPDVASASAPTEADEAPAARRLVPRRPKQCTIGYRYYDVERNGMRIGRQVPSLRLYGLWLEGIGFAVGGKVRITMANGALLITAAPAGTPPAAKKRHRRKVAP
ncbi:type I toxin-antitoxin system SymE family toxin [Xanthomonas sp. A2111]|uniref:SymE family type I addiction module toxin n=1 Tax=Xanthomonas hawaiiensis TaxID=3003247 RepID=A0ABU2I6Q4_9XANT|nr:SymE family type I addiction module toxin [Xanthomonas sp. A2111]MBO9829415.1 type I toxin-antitoxin system SymE family toxin [Xanthomonas sp. A2111]MDS9993823.1 SymE family type I addiction module toxin [Xanthomonas sp. A2111]